MKVQYFGDVNDYQKFALLRALARGGFRIGVIWMLTPDDRGSDGGNRSYLRQPDKWRSLDPELFDAMKCVPTQPKPTDMQRIECEGIVPGAVFFDDATPTNRDDRFAWHANAMSATADADLAFFDPDNGLSVTSYPKGRKNSAKYVLTTNSRITTPPAARCLCISIILVGRAASWSASASCASMFWRTTRRSGRFQPRTRCSCWLPSPHTGRSFGGIGKRGVANRAAEGSHSRLTDPARNVAERHQSLLEGVT